MKEIEVKILEVNKDEVINKLKNLGAEKVFDGKVIVSRFDFRDGSLTKQKKKLRLRRKGKEIELTFKKTISKEKAKIMEEFNVNLNNFEDMGNIFEEIGLKKIFEYTKHRTSYLINDVRFEIDDFKIIPVFLEIEAPSLEKIKEFVKKLGFYMKDAKPWSRYDVLKHYKKLS